jgi:hypothetical protein
MSEWWSSLSTRQRFGGALTVLAILMTLALAVLGSIRNPPGAGTQGLIALAAVCAQVGSVWIISTEGKAEPTMAQRAVGRLFRYGQHAAQARALAEGLSQKGVGAGDLRDGVRALNVHLSYLEEGYVESIEDWRVFHPRVVERAEGRSPDDE